MLTHASPALSNVLPDLRNRFRHQFPVRLLISSDGYHVYIAKYCLSFRYYRTQAPIQAGWAQWIRNHREVGARTPRILLLDHRRDALSHAKLPHRASTSIQLTVLISIRNYWVVNGPNACVGNGSLIPVQEREM